MSSHLSQTLRNIYALTDVENHSSLIYPMKKLLWHPTGWAKPRASSCATGTTPNAAALHSTQEGTAANMPQFKIL